MKTPEHFLGFPGVLVIAMSFIVSLYAVIGFFGYIKYGEETLGSITLNLPQHELLAQSVQLLMTFATFFTFALQLFVPNEVVWNGLRHRVSQKWRLAGEFCFRAFVTLILVVAAVAVPNLGPVISLVGAVCFSTLGLLCPAVVDTVQCWGAAGAAGGTGGACAQSVWPMRLRVAKNAAIGFFSLVALASGSYTSLLDIFDAYAPTAPQEHQ